MEITPETRENILGKLRKNNAKIRDCYGPIFQSYGELAERLVALHIQNERLRKDGGGGDGGDGSGDSGALKLELSELYRKKAQNDQQLIETNNRLQEREKEVASLRIQLDQSQNLVSTYMKTVNELKEEVKNQKETHQLLRDEHLALQATYSGLEEKFRKLENENRALIERWVEFKEKQVDEMNRQVEEINALQRKKMQQELAAAGSSQVPIFDPDLNDITCEVEASSRAFGTAYVPSRCKLKFEGHDNEVQALKWTPSGKRFVTGGADRKAKIWEINEGRQECKAILTGSNQAVTSLDFDSMEKQVLGTSNDYAIRFWSMENHRQIQSFTGHSDKVMCAKFRSQDSQVVSGSHDSTIKLWDLRSRRCFQTFFAGSRCNDVISSEDRGIFSGHNDKKIKSWDTRARYPSFEVILPGKITSLDMCLMDPQYLLCCTRNDSLHLIDLRTNGIVHTYCGESFRVGFDYSRAVLSPDMQYCAAGASDGHLFIWNVKSTKIEATLFKGGHESAITSVSWQPAGMGLLSCDRHRTICYWSDY